MGARARCREDHFACTQCVSQAVVENDVLRGYHNGMLEHTKALKAKFECPVPSCSADLKVLLKTIPCSLRCSVTDHKPVGSYAIIRAECNGHHFICTTCFANIHPLAALR